MERNGHKMIVVDNLLASARGWHSNGQVIFPDYTHLKDCMKAHPNGRIFVMHLQVVKNVTTHHLTIIAWYQDGNTNSVKRMELSKDQIGANLKHDINTLISQMD